MSTQEIAENAVSTQLNLGIQEQRTAWANTLAAKIATTLPAGMSKDRFAAMILATFGKNPSLAKCDPKSLAMAFLKCGQMGFYPGDARNMVALVPYKAECTVIIQYQGLAELARRHPDVKSINVIQLFKGSGYRLYWTDDGISLDIDINLSDLPNPGTVTKETAPEILDGFYAVLTTKNGGRFSDVIGIHEIEYRRKKGASGKGHKTPWDDFYLAMARKSALRKLLLGGTVPLSLEAAEALESDDREPDFEVQANAVDQTPKPTKRGKPAPAWAAPAAALPDNEIVSEPDAVDGEVVQEPVASGPGGEM